MSAAPFMLAVAVGVGYVLPPVLLRARWPRRMPAVAVGLWLSMAAAFVMALALAAHQVLAGDRHVAARGVLGALRACAADLAWGGDAAGLRGLLIPLLVIAWPLGWIAAAQARSRRARRRHADLLAVTARAVPGPSGALVLDHNVAAAYCLPGRRPWIVVTSGAMAQLSDDQMRAVLAHERAHIRGRHHLPTAIADGFARAFPALPLARHIRGQVGMLLEMAADDEVVRRHRPVDLATAIYMVASAQTPPFAFGAGGESLARMERLGEPATRPRRALGLGLNALVLLAPLTALLLSCTSHRA